MIRHMRLGPRARKLALTLAFAMPLAGAPGAAVAQETDVPHDGRLEGYGEPLAREGGSRTVAWLGFGALAAISLLALFKDAKRSHLD